MFDEEVKTENASEASEPVYEDVTLVCKDCGEEFVFTAGEQRFYAEKGFRNKPRACKACRNKRKESMRAERELYTAVCDNCGGEAKLTFRPTSDRPVYCSKCFEEMKQKG